jgi:hypothetical protein
MNKKRKMKTSKYVLAGKMWQLFLKVFIDMMPSYPCVGYLERLFTKWAVFARWILLINEIKKLKNANLIDCML